LAMCYLVVVVLVKTIWLLVLHTILSAEWAELYTFISAAVKYVIFVT